MQLGPGLRQLVLGLLQLVALAGVLPPDARELLLQPREVVGQCVEEPADLVRIQTTEPDGELLAPDLVRTPRVR